LLSNSIFFYGFSYNQSPADTVMLLNFIAENVVQNKRYKQHFKKDTFNIMHSRIEGLYVPMKILELFLTQKGNYGWTPFLMTLMIHLDDIGNQTLIHQVQVQCLND